MNRQPVDIAALTGARAFAAWWVVAYHTRNLFAPWVPAEFLAFLAAGDLAVDLFFTLSGFVIYLNYSARIEGNRVSIADFIVRRVARIYPLHFLMLTLMILYVVLLLLVAGKPPSHAYPLPMIPLHLLLMQGWGLTDRIGWNVPSWSISTELVAYCAFPFIALYLRWSERAIGTLLLAAGGSLLALHAFIILNGFDSLGEDISHAGLARCLTQFLTGTILSELYMRYRSHGRMLAPVALVGSALLVSAHIGLGWAESLTMPLAWAALVVALAMWPWPAPGVLTARPIVYLGEISYSTYLVHVLAYTVFKLLLIPDRSAVGPATTLLFFLIVLLLSVVLYHGFERPAQRWIIRRWKDRARAEPV